jgi:hypothetical protein
MVGSSETLIEIDYSDNFQEQMERYDPVSQPRCNLLIKVGGVWISGKDTFLQTALQDFSGTSQK